MIKISPILTLMLVTLFATACNVYSPGQSGLLQEDDEYEEDTSPARSGTSQEEEDSERSIATLVAHLDELLIVEYEAKNASSVHDQAIVDAFYADDSLNLKKLMALVALADSPVLDIQGVDRTFHSAPISVRFVDGPSSVRRNVGATVSASLSYVRIYDLLALKLGLNSSLDDLGAEEVLRRQLDMGLAFFAHKPVPMNFDLAKRFADTRYEIRDHWNFVVGSDDESFAPMLDYFYDIDLIAFHDKYLGLLGEQEEMDRKIDQLQAVYSKPRAAYTPSIKTGFWRTNYGIYAIVVNDTMIRGFHHNGSHSFAGEFQEDGSIVGTWYDQPAHDHTSPSTPPRKGGSFTITKIDAETQEFQGSFTRLRTPYRSEEWAGSRL